MDINRNSNKKLKAAEDERQTSCSGFEGGDEESDQVDPQDFALGIPDILEHILSFLNRETLLECRFVSHNWRSVATKVMKDKKRVISITFSLPSVPPFVASTPSLRTVPELISFFEETYIRGASPLDLSGFPCNALNFFSCLLLGDPDVQSLLDVYGKHLKRLCFCCSSSSEAQSESVFIQQVENLLGVQAPKLQHLVLQGLKLTPEPADHGQSTYYKASASSLESTEMKLMKNKHLNFLSLDGATRRVIDCIVAMSPNLFEIEPPNCGDFYLLLEPTNILHYVKKWDLNSNIIYFPTNNWMNIESLEAALLSAPERQIKNLTPMVQCTLLSVFFEDQDNMTDYFNSNEDARLSFERVINKILESSWNSLEHIGFVHTEEILKGIKWPRVMPKAKRIYSEPKESCGLEIFPLDGSFKIQNTFPKIKEISFDVAIENILNSSSEDFLRKSKLGPISSKCVTVRILADSADRLVNLADMGGEERLVEYYSENLLNKLVTCGNAHVWCELPYPLPALGV